MAMPRSRTASHSIVPLGTATLRPSMLRRTCWLMAAARRRRGETSGDDYTPHPRRARLPLRLPKEAKASGLLPPVRQEAVLELKLLVDPARVGEELLQQLTDEAGLDAVIV